jgi:hypothetical protein
MQKVLDIKARELIKFIHIKYNKFLKGLDIFSHTYSLLLLPLK